MKLKDEGSTVGLLTNPKQPHRFFKEKTKLARLLRQKRLSNECCQKKLVNVQRHYQGKPLHTLCFSDVVCCCEKDIAEIAQVQENIHALYSDDDDDNLDDGADTNMTSNCLNVVETGVCKDAAQQDSWEDICVDAHGGLVEGYGNGEEEGTHVDNGEDAQLVVRGASTVKDLQSCTSEPTHQVFSMIKNHMRQPHTRVVRGAITEKDLQSCTSEPAQQIKNHMCQPRMKRFKPFSYHDDSSRPHISHDLLLDVLLRCMPLAQIISARVVCRAWHEVLTSPQCFNLLSKNPHAARRYIIVQTSSSFNSSGLTFFDKERKCWPCTPIELPHLPLLAAAGGLLCFGDNFSSPSWSGVLLVGNPLTQQWKELPPSPILEEEEGHSPWFGMSADWQEACYKVFVVYSYSDRMCIYVYESAIGQWKAFKQDHAKAVVVDNDLDASLLKRTFTVSPQGCLLQVSCGERRILSYNVVDGSFREIKLGDPLGLDVYDLNSNSAPYARLPTILSCGEKIYLVGRTNTVKGQAGGRLPFVVHGSLGIWQLRESSTGRQGDWGWPIAEMLNLECAIEGSDGSDFYVTTDCWSTIYFFLTGGTTMLTYDVRVGSWRSRPGCPGTHHLNLQGEAYYEPLMWPFLL